MEGCGTIQGHIKMALVTLFWPIVLLYMFIKYTFKNIRMVVSNKVE